MKSLKNVLPLLFLLASAGLSHAATETMEIDPAHSTIGFRIKHMMVSTVTGTYGKFSGTVNLDDADVAKSNVNVDIEAGSINTGIADRDAHLASADFFDVAKFPKITFKSTKVEKGSSPDALKVTGDFTMHGVTKSIVLDVTKTGPVGGRMGFSAATKINRKDYGLTYNKVIEAGGVALGEEVDVMLDVAAAKPKPKDAAGK